MTGTVGRPLTGRHVVTTRDEPGHLDSRLAALGADVVHVPLIEIVEPDDDGDELRRALDDLAAATWLIVTSRHGARRVAEAAARHPDVRLAAVGTSTGRELTRVAGRPVDLVPDRQTALDLVAAMPTATAGVGGRVVVAQADRADTTLVDGLIDKGWSVDAVTAYGTRLRVPTPAERRAALAADAVTFASGSAVTAWVEAFGQHSPAVAVAIGPTTDSVATELGLQITHVAADHSLEGLADAVNAALSDLP